MDAWMLPHRMGGTPEVVQASPGRAAAAPGRRRLRGWIVIGSTGRNSGKTEFACAIIRALHRHHPIIGIKVTAITDGEAVCPRGESGCGACASLDADYRISEEQGEEPGKDTARMLRSGARRALWVRCRRDRLQAALGALLPRVDPGTLVVAESNSLAQAIEPDLFLMVKNGRSASVKPTAAEVISLAQRVVVSGDGVFDLDTRQIRIVNGVWRIADGWEMSGGRAALPVEPLHPASPP
jgi:hypothetical protein